VIVAVIGVLIAIAIPCYVLARQRSCDATALSDVINAGKAMETLDPRTPAFAQTVLGPGELRSVPGASVSKGTTLFVRYGREDGQPSYIVRAVHRCGRATFFYANGRPYAMGPVS
jgi:Tfp pilus assembly protein PilE